ncbi:hypothetical protein sch_05930 [Serratia plymuthica]|nr:hypothetical protein sch_05930 [Serratia plymuthica]
MESHTTNQEKLWRHSLFESSFIMQILMIMKNYIRKCQERGSGEQLLVAMELNTNYQTLSIIIRVRLQEMMF